MALPNNPTQAQVVAEVKRLESDKYDASNPSGFLSSAYTRIKDGVGTEYAASSTRNGVMFAGESGIEVVKQDVSGDSASIMMRIRPASNRKIPTTTEWDGKENANTCLKLDGSNEMTGTLNLFASGANGTNIGENGIRWNSTSCPQDSAPQYFCTIASFADGGRQMWANRATVRTSLGKDMFPVNSVLFNTDNVSPASYIGGTWTSLGAAYLPTWTSTPVKTNGRHDNRATMLKFDYISGSATYECNQTSAQNALISDGVSLTISQLNGSSWGSNWGGFGSAIPSNLWAEQSGYITVYAWKRTA